jgi:hypothetical protein
MDETLYVHIGGDESIVLVGGYGTTVDSSNLAIREMSDQTNQGIRIGAMICIKEV